MKYIDLTRGFKVMVDDEDYEWLSFWKWCANQKKSKFYAYRSEGPRKKQRMIYMHRQILGAKKGQIVDHINRDPLDNRRCNLRFCNWYGNAANSVKPSKQAPYRGVWHDYRLKINPYWAALQHKGKGHYLGVHPTAEDAARAYDKAAEKIWGEFAVLNFPQEDFL